MKDLKNMTIQEVANYIETFLKLGYSKEYIQRIIKL